MEKCSSENSFLIDTIRSVYATDDFIPLHAPVFMGNEKAYLIECIDSTFVSSVGKYVDIFEKKLAEFSGAQYAIATSTGTSALHLALVLAGVDAGDEVLTQPLTFVATCNAIAYTGAEPVFIDVSKQTLGMCAESLEAFLTTKCKVIGDKCINQDTGKTVKACIPMHSFGHIGNIEKIAELCEQYNVFLIEDSAESLGSYLKGKHSGLFGKISALSFNGNKILTTGGGGALITNDAELAKRAKHLSTTAKVAHRYNFYHDELGYNYRLPNINAALGVAQLEKLDFFLAEKRKIYQQYKDALASCNSFYLLAEPKDCQANYWLNSVIFADRASRDVFLEQSNDNGVMTRPIWELMTDLPMYKDCYSFASENARWIADRLVNIPSGVAA